MAEELRKNSVQSSSTALFRSEVVVGKYGGVEKKFCSQKIKILFRKEKRKE